MCMLGGEAAGGGCGATTGGCGDDICLGGDGELRSLLDESMTESMLIVVPARSSDTVHTTAAAACAAIIEPPRARSQSESERERERENEEECS
jgi:hypothetical protein